jgi:hypothetical protein
VYQAEGFRFLHAYASPSGYDTATLHGTAGADEFKARSDQPVQFSFLTDWANYFLRAKGFDAVVAHGEGGQDNASFFDTPGDDTLEFTPTETSFFGPGHYNRVHGFANVLAIAREGGVDSASLWDSDGDDTFTATPTHSMLGGVGSSGAAYKVDAHLFDFVHAYGSEGRETAYFSDSPGNDRFVGKPEFSFMQGSGFFYRAKFFEEVFAEATAGGVDQAELRDSALEDLLEVDEPGGQTWARLSSDNATLDYLYEVLAFDAVTAHAGPEDPVPPLPLPTWLTIVFG